jgi:hypothetical protein
MVGRKQTTINIIPYMKTTTIDIRIALGCLAIALTAGCATNKGWVYRSNAYAPAGSSTGKKVAVLPFEDARENKNSNKWLLYMVPLMPYGSQRFDAPEGVPMHMTSAAWTNYKPTEDYPKALAEDLKKTGLFSDAFFDYRKQSADYAVKGRIVSTKYSGHIFSYGLSVYGPLLWLIGLPAASTSNELSVEFSLVDSQTDKPLFSKTYAATPRKSVSWIYVMKNDFNYSEMLAEVNKQFCQDIQPVILATITPQQTPVFAGGSCDGK